MMKNCFLPITVVLILIMGTDAKGDSFSNTNERERKGNAEAQYQLGVIYERGDSQEQNFYKAIRWHRKAANKVTLMRKHIWESY
jgi:TPR repeat protein